MELYLTLETQMTIHKHLITLAAVAALFGGVAVETSAETNSPIAALTVAPVTITPQHEQVAPQAVPAQLAPSIARIAPQNSSAAPARHIMVLLVEVIPATATTPANASILGQTGSAVAVGPGYAFHLTTLTAPQFELQLSTAAASQQAPAVRVPIVTRAIVETAKK